MRARRHGAFAVVRILRTGSSTCPRGPAPLTFRLCPPRTLLPPRPRRTGRPARRVHRGRRGHQARRDHRGGMMRPESRPGPGCGSSRCRRLAAVRLRDPRRRMLGGNTASRSPAASAGHRRRSDRGPQCPPGQHAGDDHRGQARGGGSGPDRRAGPAARAERRVAQAVRSGARRDPGGLAAGQATRSLGDRTSPGADRPAQPRRRRGAAPQDPARHDITARCRRGGDDHDRRLRVRSRALAIRFEHVPARSPVPGRPARPARWLCTEIETS